MHLSFFVAVLLFTADNTSYFIIQLQCQTQLIFKNQIVSKSMFVLNNSRYEVIMKTHYQDV